MKIYTLQHAMTGDRSILNGKLLKVRKEVATGRLTFLDATTNKALWCATKLATVDRDEFAAIITTSSGSRYDLLDVSKLIPTAAKPIPMTAYMELRSGKPADTLETIPELEEGEEDEAGEEATPAEEPSKDAAKPAEEAAEKKPDKPKKERPILPADFPMPTDEKRDDKPINYGDGFIMWTYTFPREISKDEFVLYLEATGRDIVSEEPGAWWKDYTVIEGKGNVWSFKIVKRYTD